MANNYTELSFLLPVSECHRDKAMRILQSDMEQMEFDPGYVGFDASWEDDGIWFHHDESADVDAIIGVVQHIMKECDITEPVGFCWAFTCSKPRLDEFGGGAVAITQTTIEHIDTFQWLQSALESAK